MNKILVAVILIASLSLVSMGKTESPLTEQQAFGEASSLYELTALDIEGNKVSLETYENKVVMFVNTASECGYTPQYEGLQAIYDKYKDRGFVVLGFPANNFGGQEPGSNKEIKDFCTKRFKVTFPMFAKVSVKGADQHPVFKYLTSDKQFGGEVTWNFNKFLANHKGELIGRFDSKDEPQGEKVTSAIEDALKKVSKPAADKKQ